MAAASTVLEIAGRHLAVYEDLWREVDPSCRGVISAQDAASLLKKSKLGIPVLGKIWDIADSEKRGYLDKTGLFVAFKLVALAQNGQELTLGNLRLDTPAPNFIGTGSACPSPAFGLSLVDDTAMQEDWVIKPADQEKYRAIFESLGPENGKLGGDKVKPVLLNSGLPHNVLGKIWGLSDIDRDGFLDRDEMCVALHLVYKALENELVPGVLPLNMVPPNKRSMPSVGRRPSMPVGGVPVLPPPSFGTPRSRTSSVTSVESTGLGVVPPSTGTGSVIVTPVTPQAGLPASTSGASLIGTPERKSPSSSGGVNRSLSGTPVPTSAVKPPVPWIVNKAKWEGTFLDADRDMDSLVTGSDVKILFMQSGLAQNYLAHIWGLVDLNKTGKLNLEQFALAMHLIEQKRENNVEPPAALPPDLIPPSFRPPAAGMTDMGTSTQEASSSAESGSSAVKGTGQVASGNKELDALLEEIGSIQMERRDVESGIVQLEADMTVKQSEIKNLDVEANTLDSTVKQLERQKGEANRRLSDLDTQKGALQKTLEELNDKLNTEQHEVNSLKVDVEQSASSKQSQEEELNRKRQELASLREEENRLEVNLQMEKANLDTAAQQHGAMEKQIQQMESQSSKLRQHTSSLQEKLEKLEEILSTGNLENLEREESTLLAALEQFKFPISGQRRDSWLASGYQANAFALSSRPYNYDGVPMESPKIVKSESISSASAFPAVDDPFKQILGDPFGNAASNGADPFASSDPFGGSAGFASDPFASSQPPANDPFASSGGADPFVPSWGSESTSPGDPFASSGGKKAPPRPAPPKGRPVTPRSGLDSPGDPFAGNDPFAGTGQNGGDGSFANFADFSNFS